MTSGISPQYEQAIQSFILAAIAAYKAGYSLTALKFELANNEIKGEYMGRDMSLNDSEKETRLIWIMLVYMTLRFRGFPSERRPPDVGEEVQGRLKEMAVGLRKLVEDICEAEGKGFSLEGLKMERALGGGESGLTPAQASVRSQWSRIVFSTLKLLPGRSP